MGEFQVSGSELKKLVNVMRKQPISFAFNPAKKIDDDYFGLHRTKPAKTIGREAKDEGEGDKYAFGTAKVEGKILSLTCERVIPSLAKKLKRYLKSQKVMLNVEVLDASGNVLESDIEDLPDDAEMEEEAESVEEASPKGKVAKRVFLIERWKKIPGELNVQLGVLNREIASKVPQEDPDDFCKGVEEWFAKLVEELQSDLNDAIDTSINAGDDTYSAVSDVIRKGLRPRIANDQVVALFKKGSLLQGNAFEDAFTKAFDEIEAALTA